MTAAGGGAPTAHTLPLVIDEGGARRLVAVRLQAVHTNHDLASALAAHIGRDSTDLWSTLRGKRLDPSARALHDGLRAGERLSFEPLASVRMDRSPRLVVVGGPACGTEDVVSREATVGRGAEVSFRVNDPAMSQKHFAVAADDTVKVLDLDSTNGTFVNGVRVSATEPSSLGESDVIEAGDSLFAIRPPAVEAHRTDGTGAVPFNRPPRVRGPGPPAGHTLPAPPSDPTKPRLPMAAALGPLLMGGVMYFTASGGTRYMGLAMAAMGPVMALLSLLESRKGSSGTRATESAKFAERLDAVVKSLVSERTEEVRRLRETHPDIALLVDRARSRAPQLWARRPSDPDFTSVSFGHADLPFPAPVTIAEGGSDDDRRRAMEKLQPLLRLHAAPVTARLDAAGVVGLAGDEGFTSAAATSVVMQVVGTHSPSDVAVVAMLTPARSEQWWWLPLLPHVRAPELRVSARRIATSTDDANEMLDELSELSAARRSNPDQRAGGAAPFVVVVIDEALGLNRARLRSLLQSASATAMALIWIGSDPRELPGESGLILRPAASGLAELVEPGVGRVVGDVRTDRFPPEVISDVAEALAALRDVSGAGAGATIPSIVPMRQLFPTEVITADVVKQRWDDQPRDLVAPIGLDGDGPVSVAFRRDGPHALVGGTTGAGKSELLQTWVAMLASTFPPSRLNFLLVDYKGGAAFRECVDLPHVVGMVTDLDPHLMTRVVRSLRAELNHRMRVLERADVSDIVSFEKRGAEGLANLIIIVDEFAQLAKDLPTFVEKVIEIAAIGRSLGVHLVLATQRPSESIGAAIQANTNLRIALRTAKAEESTNIIGSPPAAFIDRTMPGRCFVKVGEGQPRQMQAAYAGTAALGESERVADDEVEPIEVAIYDRGEPRFERAAVAASPRTELNAVVESTRALWSERGGAPSRVPWLPPLPGVLPHSDLGTPGDASAFSLVLGRADLPDIQEQRPWSLELGRDGSALVYGTTGAGKTALLRTAAVQAARLLPPTHLHIQALDFGGRGLAGLDVLPHCGTVVVGEQKALVQRMVRHLARELATRAAILERAAVTSIDEHNQKHPDTPLPRLLVLVDGVAAMASAFERVDAGESMETLQHLATEGRAVGMHFLLTTNRRSGTPMASTIARKVVLRMADPDDYSSLGLPDARDIAATELPPGRGFVEDLEVQIALVGEDPAGDAQRRAIGEMASQLPRQGEGRVPVIRLLPFEVRRSALHADVTGLQVVIGEQDETHEPHVVDLAKGHFFVAGPYRSGRTTALHTIASGLVANGVDVVVLAARPSALAEIAGATTHVGEEAIVAFVQTMPDLVEERSRSRSPLAIVFDDGDAVAIDSYTADLMAAALKTARQTSVRLVVGAEVKAAFQMYGGWAPEVRKDQFGLLLQPDVDTDGSFLGVGLPRRLISEFPPGRGFVAERGVATLLQVAMPG